MPVPPGTYEVLFAPGQGASEWWDDVPTRDQATPITVNDGDDITLDAVLGSTTPTTTTTPPTTTSTTTTSTPTTSTTTPVVPSAPRSLEAIPGWGQVTLTWLPPLSDGGSPFFYLIQRSPNGTTGWVDVSTLNAPVTSHAMGSLTIGTVYYFRVLAGNVHGVSPWSNTASAIPAAPTSPARTLTATPTNASGQIRLSWLPPADNGSAPITDYFIQRSPDGLSSWVPIDDGVSTTTSYTVTGLTNGTRYYFRVLARNEIGNSPSWSNVVSAVPRTVPSAVRSLTAVPTNLSGQIRLSWLLPASNGGSPITDYIIQRSPNGTTGWLTINDGVRHDHELHRHGFDQRHPLLLPGAGQERRRQLGVVQHRQQHPDERFRPPPGR